MRVTRLSAQDGPTKRGWTLDRLSTGLNCVTAETPELAAAAELLAHLVMGWRESAPRFVALEGEAAVATSSGDALLRRRTAADGQRLTIATSTSHATPLSVAAWRAQAPVEVLTEVLCGSNQDTDRAIHRLLSPRVATAIRALLEKRPSNDQPTHEVIGPEAYDLPSDAARRRDLIAGEIERLLAAGREEAAALDQAFAAIAKQREAAAHELAMARDRLATIDAQLHTAESRARYQELSRAAEEAQSHRIADDFQPRRDDLDNQIGRWRQTLRDLDHREAALRDELARDQPEDRRPELTLADQRACVAVASRLIADLESEVARFASATDGPHCVCSDAHPRLNPLVETLGQHIQRLSSLVAEQGGALRWQELSDEAERLERSRGEIRQQLDKLLERRETLIRTTRARTQADRRSDVELSPGFDRPQAELTRADLAVRIGELESNQATLDRRADELSERRTRLFRSAELVELNRQLAEAEAIPATLPGGIRRAGQRKPLRASAALAKLSDGEFRELKLVGGGRGIEVVSARGERIGLAGLSHGQRTLALWALRLALADACLVSGVTLPIVVLETLGESGGALSDQHTANLVTLLDDLRRTGAQVFVFTNRPAAIERLASLGHSARRLSLSGSFVEPVAPASPIVEAVAEETSTTLLSPADPVERFPVPIADRANVFALSRVRTLEELMLADPSVVAEELGRDDVTPELVALWQAHLSLVCFVASLDLQDAKWLSQAGVLSTAELAECDAATLRTRLQKAGADAARLERCEDWVELANDALDRWEANGFAQRWARHHQERKDRIRTNARRRKGGESSLRLRTADEAPARSKRAESKAKQLRFYLDVDDDIEAAPSIGPKRAAQLTDLGVATVQQLLDADPSDLADRLGHSRIDGGVIVAWQHQASLVCRIPGLRGHDAQVLVGSGFTTPEEIATMKPSDLFEFVDAYCDTSEGQRALRGGHRPDTEEVSQWIAGARKRRVLGAA